MWSSHLADTKQNGTSFCFKGPSSYLFFKLYTATGHSLLSLLFTQTLPRSPCVGAGTMIDECAMSYVQRDARARGMRAPSQPSTPTPINYGGVAGTGELNYAFTLYSTNESFLGRRSPVPALSQTMSQTSSGATPGPRRARLAPPQPLRRTSLRSQASPLRPPDRPDWRA